jgi:hypothetical protein
MHPKSRKSPENAPAVPIRIKKTAADRNPSRIAHPAPACAEQDRIPYQPPSIGRRIGQTQKQAWRFLAANYLVVLPFFLEPSPFASFPFELGLIGFLLRIAGCIFHLAPGLLGLPFDLLRGAIYLGVRIAGPLANLAFRAPGNIVNSAFDSVLIHFPPPWIL